jgi:hypothetical protein
MADHPMCLTSTSLSHVDEKVTPSQYGVHLAAGHFVSSFSGLPCSRWRTFSSPGRVTAILGPCLVQSSSHQALQIRCELEIVLYPTWLVQISGTLGKIRGHPTIIGPENLRLLMPTISGRELGHDAAGCLNSMTTCKSSL